MIVVYVDVPTDGLGDVSLSDKVARSLAERYPDQKIVKLYSYDQPIGARVRIIEEKGFIERSSWERQMRLHRIRPQVDMLLECSIYGKKSVKSLAFGAKNIPHVKINEYSWLRGCVQRHDDGFETFKLRPGLGSDEIGVYIPENVPQQEKAHRDNSLGMSYVHEFWITMSYMHNHLQYCLKRQQSGFHLAFDFAGWRVKEANKLMRRQAKRVGYKLRDIDMAAQPYNLSQSSSYDEVLAAIDKVKQRYSERRVYVSLIMPYLSGAVFRRLQAHTGPMVATTGDHSTTDAWMQGKVVNFEWRLSKAPFYKHYLKRMKSRLSSSAYQCLLALNTPDEQVSRREAPSRPKLRRLLTDANLEEISKASAAVVREKHMMLAVNGLTDKLILPSTVKQALLELNGAHTIRVKVRHFLDAIDRGAPTRSKRLCGIVPAMNRQRIDDFILRARVDCANGSIRTQDLPAVFAKSLNELMQVLVKNERKSTPSRSIRCIMDAAKAHFGIDFDRPNVAGASDLSRHDGVETKPVC